MENGEAICSFGEAITFYDYNVSSGPSFFLIIDIDIESETRGPGPILILLTNVQIVSDLRFFFHDFKSIFTVSTKKI